MSAASARNGHPPAKFSVTGPFSLFRRIQHKAYSQSVDLVRALAHVLNAEARALAAKGARLLQIDEPFLAGCPEEVGVAVEAINIVTTSVDVTWGLHVCYEDLEVIQRFGWDRALDIFPANKLIINPDCGLRHLPLTLPDRTRSKLVAMVEGTMAVRRTLPIQAGPRTVTSAEPTVEQGA